MPTNVADAIAEVAALCVAARAKLPASGFHRLRVLLDMLLIDLDRETPPPGESGGESRPGVRASSETSSDRA